ADLPQRLGVSDRQVSLGNVYLDLSDDGLLVSRSNAPAGLQYPADFGRTKINFANQQALFKPPLDSLPGWLMLGAVREDDVPYDSGAIENNPQEDPQGSIIRVFHHFYDPYNDQALTIGDTAFGVPAPEWALLPSARNDFSVVRAREVMWRALTLKSSPAQGMADLPFRADADMPTREALRVSYWATTFRALGDVVHLLQDMAQPQHTRNDPHSGRFCAWSECYGGHASFYEKYVDVNVTGEPSFTLRERPVWGKPQDTP